MIEYRPLRKKDIPQIIALYEEHLNSGGNIAEIIRRSWEDGSYVGCVATENGKILGFLTARMGIAFTYPHPELEAELAAFVRDKRIAMCDAFLVLPDYRNRGIAHNLTARTRELLLNMSCVCFMAEIWLYPNGDSPAKAALESVGTVVWQRRYDRFYEDLERYGMSCPVCGTHCACGAWVEVMEL